MTTAQDIFELAIAMMDEMDDQGRADHSDTTEYKNRTLPILNILRGELYPYSDTYMIQDSGRPIAALITDFDVPIELDDYICQSVMPYGLAANLLVDENPSAASFYQARYEELLRQKAMKMQAAVGEIEDLYGVLGYNNGAIWG
jgi:hypothetical protein